MSMSMVEQPPRREQAAAREAAIARGAAAYAFFAASGLALAGAGWCVVMDWDGYMRALGDPLRENFWALVLPGVAAVMGAAAVHRPFMRAVRARRDPYAHAWAAAGVAAAHAAYAGMMFLAVAGGRLFFGHYGPLTETVEETLVRAAEEALAVGFVSAVLGLLPNVLIATGFTGLVLRAARRRGGQGVAPGEAK